MTRWRATLKRNWPYMLTGTLISVFLWVAVSADTVDEQTLPADLVIINSDRRYVLTEREPATDEISVLFTGQAGDLALLSVSRPQIVVQIDRVDSLVWEVALSPAMVRGRGNRQLTDVRAVSVRPNRFRLHFEPRAQKVVRVVPRVRVTPAEGFALADSARAEPGAIAVEGPEEAVAGIDSVLTVPVVRERLRESLFVEAPLQRPEPRRLLELSSLSVRVIVAVEPRVERLFPSLQVAVAGVDSAGLSVEPPTVSVRIAGPRSAVRAVRVESLTPWVELGGPADLEKAAPIRVRAPSPLVSVTVEPDSAVVREVETSAQPGGR